MTTQTDPEGTETKYLLRYAELAKGGDKHVLEAGCGDGRLTWRYARMAQRIVGIDLHEDELRAATIDRPTDLTNRVYFTQADATYLPLRSQSFDLAIFAWSF